MTHAWKQPLFFNLEDVESIAEEEAEVPLTYTPAVILPDEAQLEPELYEPAPISPAIALPHPSALSQIKVLNSGFLLLWLLGAAFLLMLAVFIVDTVGFLHQHYQQHVWLGNVFLLLIIAIAAALVLLSWRIYQDIKTLRVLSALQRRGQQLFESNSYGDARAYLNQIAQLYQHRADVKPQIDRFQLMVNDSYDDREMCTLFANQVMHVIDQQAYSIVSQRAKETAFMVMISQIALLDTLLTLWRNVRMIRDIAVLYGGRPGFLGSLKLVGGVLQNLIYADVSELLADTTAEILGGSVLSVMSAQVAQGVGSGVLTARLGVQAMQLCRPLPFSATQKPRVKTIRWEIIASLKHIFEQKNKATEHRSRARS